MWAPEHNDYSTLTYALGAHPPAPVSATHSFSGHATTRTRLPPGSIHSGDMVPETWPSLPAAPPHANAPPLMTANALTMQPPLNGFNTPHLWAHVPYVNPYQVHEPLYPIYSYSHGHESWISSQLVSPTATEISNPASGASRYASTLSPVVHDTPVIKREAFDVRLPSPVSPVVTHSIDPCAAYPTPVADEVSSPPPSLADLLGPPAPKCVPLRTTGVCQEMKRMMGVFRLDPFATHDGMHAATRTCGAASVASVAEHAAEAGEHGNRLRDHVICWNGDIAGPHRDPSLLVEFQADLEDPDNLVPYQERFPRLFPQETPSPVHSPPALPLLLLGLDEQLPRPRASSNISDLEYLRYPSPELEPKETLVFRHPGCNVVC